MFVCNICSGPMRDIPCFRKRRKTCSKKCFKAWLSKRAKNKQFIDNGYKRVLVPYSERVGKIKYVMEHRLIMERHIGRKLSDDEVVHHKNHNRSDNRISNLQVMTHAAHSSHHVPKKNGRWSVKFDKCILCKRTDRPHHVRGRCEFCRWNNTGVAGTRYNRWNNQLSVSTH